MSTSTVCEPAPAAAVIATDPGGVTPAVVKAVPIDRLPVRQPTSRCSTITVATTDRQL